MKSEKKGGVLATMGVCVLVAGFLTLAAAMMPPRGRLLGIFPLAFGALIGVLAALAAAYFVAGRSRAVILIAMLSSFVGYGGQGMLQYSNWKRQVDANHEELMKKLAAVGFIGKAEVKKLEPEDFLKHRFHAAEGWHENRTGWLWSAAAFELLLAAGGAWLGFVVFAVRGDPQEPTVSA